MSTPSTPAPRGTRFRVFPQYGFREPEIVTVMPRGTIHPGPSDDDIRTVDARDHTSYWESDDLHPPYQGANVRAPAAPRDGHFDHIGPGDESFRAATAFASVRRTLDGWEAYFGRTLTWWFRPKFATLELIPQAGFANAASDAGYLELGSLRGADSAPESRRPCAENFDVIAHEVGHAIHSLIIGRLPGGQRTLEFQGHMEAFCDLVAIVASLHFDAMVAALLERTHGNLFGDNLLARIGDLPGPRARLAFNAVRMSTVGSRADKYDFSKPFTGAVFDLLVEIYEAELVERGAIAEGLARRSYNPLGSAPVDVQAAFDTAFAAHPDRFMAALTASRDAVGRLLARGWAKTSTADQTYARVVQNLLRADEELTAGRRRPLIRACFDAREIAHR